MFKFAYCQRLREQWRFINEVTNISPDFLGENSGLKGLSDACRFFQNVVFSVRHRRYRSISFTATDGYNEKTRSYRPRRILPALQRFVLICALISPVLGATDFKKCMADVQNGDWGPVGGTDSRGNPVANISQATGITYDLCLRACGPGSEPFNWPSFSQQFSAWLLPWLALVSQLPFGARLRQENWTSIVLAVGSPTLAAYSIILTVMNTQWLHRKFRNIHFPNSQYAVRILNNLQQVPLRIVMDESLFASLVVLAENDPWWVDLADRLDYTHTWSLATAASVAWVVIAYIFTVISAFGSQSFSDVQARVGLDGQAVGSAWLWLLPVVIGWQRISPKSDYNRIGRAINRANENAYVVTDHGIVKSSEETEERAVSLATYSQGSPAHDQECSPPIFNYARFLPWIQAVEDVHTAFFYASRNAAAHHPVDPNVQWTNDDVAAIDPGNRTGTAEQVDEYCRPPQYVRPSGWRPDIFSRFFVASVLALFVQWGTSGAAALFAYFTPTRGLGCRSGSYLIYASVSTVIWAILVVSTILAHYSSQPHRPNDLSVVVAKWLSVGLRWLGKALAACNAIWIIAICVLQFGNFFSRCYCSSSVLGLGSRAFAELIFTADDESVLWSAWRGAAVIGPASCFVFLVYIYVYIDPPLPG